MSLHPTKTRVALLAAVERGDVLDLPDPDNDGHTATFDLTDAEIGMPARRVNARVDEFVREGWVRLSVDHMTWVLTAAGLDVLNEATR